MLGVTAIVAVAVIGVGINAVPAGLCHTTVLATVDEHRHVLTMLLDDPVAIRVIPVIGDVAVLRESRQAVLLVPAESLLTGTLHGIWLSGHVGLQS